MSADPETADRLSLDAPVALLRKMNHDIRNPLNAVLATANMLTEGMYEPLTAGQDRAVKRIERNALRILALLDDLIGYAKGEAGELQPVATDFDPRKLIDTIQAECQPVAAAKGLAFSASTADSVPATVHNDETLTRKIIAALAWNAISFTTQGNVQIDSAWADGWTIIVKDTGPGVPAAAANHIFDVFWRGDVAGSQVPTSGSGLGLTAAQAYTKLLKGQLTLKETGAKGSTFELRLPNLQ